tara:strand:+ start:180 stop:371 length:192 start_codon:yes stop_codon:yes gene_type:complete
MKPKKEITEQDLEILERHINTTKIRLIDMNNQLNKALGKIRGTIVILIIVLVILSIFGYIILI